MEFLMDPTIWAGLLTLVVLEIVLGIDNLVFIAILADKLPPKQRDKARIIGLSLALIMRLGLLSVISWMVTLTKPLISIGDFSFSGRDLIMLVGGIFLLFKATTELHERLENRQHDAGHGKGYASFWVVVLQIVVLDAGCGDYRRRHGEPFAGDDGCGRYCDDPDAAGLEAVNPLREPTSDGCRAVSELPADDWSESGG